MTKRLPLVVAKARSYLPYDATRTIVITGSPRSGTTWLAEMINTLDRSSILWEPCHLANMPKARAAGMTWRTHLDEDERAPTVEAYIGRVLAGRELNWWTARLVGYTFTRTWIVKFVRANRMLAWLTHRFVTRRPLLLLRHPCAVVASQLEWGLHADATPPEEAFVTRYPHLRHVYGALSTPEERLAFVWAADAYVPLTSAARDRWRLVLFEQLVRDPVTEVAALFEEWRLAVPEGLRAQTRRPSGTVSARLRDDMSTATMTGWQRRISSAQADRVLAVTRAFGLDFYGEDEHPDLDHPLLKGIDRPLP